MHMIKLLYNVSLEGVSPIKQQSAGVQGDKNVTALEFVIADNLKDKMQEKIQGQSDKWKYRFDCTDGASGTFSTGLADYDNSSNPIYTLDNNITQYGGNITVCLVFTLISNDKTEIEMYQYPVMLKLKNTPSGKPTDGIPKESISTLAQQTSQYVTTAYTMALRAETAQNEASKHANDASDAADRAETAESNASGSATHAEKSFQDAYQAKLTAHTYALDARAYSQLANESAVRAETAAKNADKATEGKMDKFGEVIDIGTDKMVDNPDGGFVFGTKEGAETVFLTDKIRLSSSHGKGTPIKEVATPDGTDPTQAANVEFVATERRMRLIVDYVTQNDSEECIFDLDKSEKPFKLDAFHVDIDTNSIPANTNIAGYVNKGWETWDTTKQFCSLNVGSNSSGTCWIHAEKMANNRWFSIRAALNSLKANRLISANNEMETVETVTSIRIAGSYAAGTKIRIWGRDAI